MLGYLRTALRSAPAFAGLKAWPLGAHELQLSWVSLAQHLEDRDAFHLGIRPTVANRSQQPMLPLVTLKEASRQRTQIVSSALCSHGHGSLLSHRPLWLDCIVFWCRAFASTPSHG